MAKVSKKSQPKWLAESLRTLDMRDQLIGLISRASGFTVSGNDFHFLEDEHIRGNFAVQCQFVGQSATHWFFVSGDQVEETKPSRLS